MPASRRVWILLAIAIGGSLGTVARYELTLALPVESGHLPWATLIENVVGSLVIGIAVVAFQEARPPTDLGRAFVAIGFCGGLTTFSTWMMENVLLARDGDVGVAVLYITMSLVAGLAAVGLGVGTARRLLRRPVPVFDPELDD